MLFARVTTFFVKTWRQNKTTNIEVYNRIYLFLISTFYFVVVCFKKSFPITDEHRYVVKDKKAYLKDHLYHCHNSLCYLFTIKTDK